MLISGNLFNYQIKTKNKKIKIIYLLSLFLQKTLKYCLLINLIINCRFLKNILNTYLFIFYFNKTKNVLYLSYKTPNIFDGFLQQKFFFNIKNQTKHTQIIVVYLKIFLLNNYNKYLFLQNKKNNISVVSSILSKLPKNSTSSVYKNISLFDYTSSEFQFLRKNKVYNKGRYSRCRQNYRTGVYLCMYLSIVSIFGLYYWFFKFSFNFSYLWWFFIGFFSSFLLPKIIKYRLYEITTVVHVFYGFFSWLSVLFKSLKG